MKLWGSQKGSELLREQHLFKDAAVKSNLIVEAHVTYRNWGGLETMLMDRNVFIAVVVDVCVVQFVVSSLQANGFNRVYIVHRSS